MSYKKSGQEVFSQYGLYGKKKTESISPDRLTILLFILCWTTALFLRLWDLELKPLHHDEGVNGWFLLRLLTDHFYHYDPANYHGPFLFYLGLIPLHLAETSTFFLRLMPALFGTLMIGLLAPLYRWIGRAGVIAAGILLALSPANVFYSRYIIHETYLAFFTLATVASCTLLVQTRRPLYLYLTAASLAFMVTVKETYIITFGVLGISLILARLFNLSLIQEPRRDLLKGRNYIEGFTHLWSTLWREVKGRKTTIVAGLFLFTAIIVLFYSSFFTHFKGIEGLLSTLKIWTRTGVGVSGHNKPFFYYLKVLYDFEAPILIFGILGMFYSIKKKDLFSLFTFFWGIGMFLAYSLIPYKTPWLIINLTLPLALLSGIFIQTVASSLASVEARVVFAVLFASVLGYSAYNSVDLSFRRYDDVAQELVYVHTFRDVHQLVDRINSISRKSEGNRIAINIASSEQWPLKWYLRDYTGVSYWGKVIDRPDSPIIIGRDLDIGLLESRLTDQYQKESYRLRPGINLVLYVQKRLWDRWFIDSLEKREGFELPPGGIVEPGLAGRYYRERNFAGQPFLTRFDTSPNFSWTSQATRLIQGAFSAEWEGHLWIAEPGRYQFTVESDDGSWVYIDDALVVDNGGAHPLKRSSGTVDLNKGHHRIKMRYFDIGGEAVLRLLWKPPGMTESPIPSDVMYTLRDKQAGLSEIAGKVAPGLWGKYFREIDFDGEFFLDRCDTAISINWEGEEAKPFRAPFSIEWEGYLLAREEGRHLFSTESDDGSWIYINNELIVDNSGKHSLRRASGAVDLAKAYHHIKIRYFDSGGGAILRLLWQPPGEKEEPIPQDVFYYVQPG